MKNLKIIEASWHRNGIAGAGFWAILFDDKENGRMIASLFDRPHYCAIYKVDELAEGNIKFAQGNSWRGDDYEDALRPLIKRWDEGDRSVPPEVSERRCCLCGGPLNDPYGHNPGPLGKSSEDRCCTACNDTKVIPARLADLHRSEIP